MCQRFIKLEDWPTYNNKLYSYCRNCKRAMQRQWVKAKREYLRDINKEIDDNRYE